MDLMDLANSMDQEEQRYVREGFSSDEELSLYDLLFSENMSKQDIQKIKHVAVDLLAKVKAKIAELDHWTDKQETKAAVDNLIRDTLWAELPECYDEVSISRYRQKYLSTYILDIQTLHSLPPGIATGRNFTSFYHSLTRVVKVS